MAKKKNEEKDFFQELAEACGGETLAQIGSEDRGWIDTGNLALNYTMSGKFVGGGLPVGINAELYGPSSAGKSLLAMNFMKGVQRAGGIAVYLDAERSVNKEFAIKASKVDPNKMVVLNPDTLKSAFYKINSTILRIREREEYKGKPICIVVDSIAALPSDEEFAETTLDMEKSTDAAIKAAGARLVDQPGVHAKTTSRELRKLMGFVADNGATVVFINQIRKQIGVKYGPDTDSASGGLALKFYCSTRIELKSTTEVKEKASEAVKGMHTKLKLSKSRFTPPRQLLENVKLMFDSGIDPFGGLLSALLHAERVKSNGGGNYSILDPWANESGVTFKASKDKNTLPLDTLLANPKLVDAKGPEDIQYYIDLYGKAITDGEGDGFIVNEIDPSDE